MKQLASYPYLTLSLHEGACRAIEARWTGVASSATLRRATLECATLVGEHSVRGWIADDRLLGPVPAQDVAWIATYVLPLLVKMGLQRFARLEAENPQTQQVVGPAQKIAQQQLAFELRTFTDVAEARAWACG
jgi:hypothetical protein